MPSTATWTRVVAVLAGLPLFNAFGPEPAHAAGPPATDIIKVESRDVCPHFVSLQGDAYPNPCFTTTSESYDAGSQRGRTITFNGPWQISCPDGARMVPGRTLGFTIGMVQTQEVARFQGHPCGRGDNNIWALVIHPAASFTQGAGAVYSFDVMVQVRVQRPG